MAFQPKDPAALADCLAKLRQARAAEQQGGDLLDRAFLDALHLLPDDGRVIAEFRSVDRAPGPKGPPRPKDM